MKSRRTRGAALALGLALISVAPAQAAVRYADPAGDASSPTCPQIDPCDLETAFEDPSVNPGDVVMVAAGSFALSNELTIDDAIEVIGAGPIASAVNSSANPALRVQAPGAAVHGVGINTSASNGVGVILLGASTGDGLLVSGRGAACRLDDQATLRDSACWNPDPSGFSAIHVDSTVGTPSPTLRNVTAYATGSSAFGLYVFADTTNVTLNASNSIFRTPAGGAQDVHAGADGTTATADVFVDHSSYAEVSTGTASTVTPAGTGTNIVAAPLFVDSGAGDFHQAAGSPTIDKGSSAVSGLSLLDFDGQARTQGANTDMGADEFPAPPTPQPPATTPTPKKKKSCKKKGKRRSAGAAKKRCKKKRK